MSRGCLSSVTSRTRRVGWACGCWEARRRGLKRSEYPRPQLSCRLLASFRRLPACLSLKSSVGEQLSLATLTPLCQAFLFPGLSCLNLILICWPSDPPTYESRLRTCWDSSVAAQDSVLFFRSNSLNTPECFHPLVCTPWPPPPNSSFRLGPWTSL